jgi:hypothetical protein
MRRIFEKVALGKSGLALEVRQCQYLRIIDLEGNQVCDMFVGLQIIGLSLCIIFPEILTYLPSLVIK